MNVVYDTGLQNPQNQWAGTTASTQQHQLGGFGGACIRGQGLWQSPPQDFEQKATTQKKKSIMKTIIDDIKSFIAEHRKIIYFVVILLIIDRFFLKRALENRIKAMAEKLLGTVEKKMDAFTNPAIEAPKP